MRTDTAESGKTFGGLVRAHRTAGLPHPRVPWARKRPVHPEGYLEAFGTIYREAFRAIAAEVEGRPTPNDLDFPTIEDGIEGMVFIETAGRSSKAGATWVRFPRV